MFRLIFGLFALLSMVPTFSVAQDESGTLGVWRTQMHGALVEMRLCSDN